MPKLKPCPFCGKSETVGYSDCRELEECSAFEECDAIAYKRVVCDVNVGGCGASGGYGEDTNAAAKKWNHRYSERECHNIHEDGDDGFVCSMCETYVRVVKYRSSYIDADGKRWYSTAGNRKLNFCPNCGARVIDND